MQQYDTPEPISVSLELGFGDFRIAASERTDTIVEVRPSDPAREADVTAAEQTRVEFADGRLSVKAPKEWRHYAWRGGGEWVVVEISLPAGSRVDAEADGAALRCSGRIASSITRPGAERSTVVEHAEARS